MHELNHLSIHCLAVQAYIRGARSILARWYRRSLWACGWSTGFRAAGRDAASLSSSEFSENDSESREGGCVPRTLSPGGISLVCEGKIVVWPPKPQERSRRLARRTARQNLPARQRQRMWSQWKYHRGRRRDRSGKNSS